MTNITNALYANQKRINQISSASFVNLQLCTIEDIDINTMSVKVNLANTGTVLTRVPFCLPAKFFDRGFIYIPEIGSKAVIGTTNNQEMFVISFVSFAKYDEMDERLLSGEMLIQSSGYGYLREDRAGNVLIGSPGGNFIKLGASGNISQFATTHNNVTIAKELVSGKVGQDVSEIEKIFDKEVSCPLSDTEVIRKAVTNQDIPIDSPSPVIVIEKGNVLNDEERLNLDGGGEMCYRLRVLDSEGNPSLTLEIDKLGQVKLSATKLILDVDTFDYSACKAVIPKV